MKSLILLFSCFLSALQALVYNQALIDQVQSALMRTGSNRGIISEPCSNRTAWDSIKVKSSAYLATDMRQANASVNTPQPVWDNDVYLMFSRNGSRRAGEQMIYARYYRFYRLVLAECVYNNGRYMNTIESDLKGILAQPSWTYPAHDGDLTNFNGTAYTVDLASALLSSMLAQTLFLLDKKLSIDTVTKVTTAMRTRIVLPVLRSLNTGDNLNWWINTDSNWNAVCWAGVLLTVHSLPNASTLATLDERAKLTTAGWVYGANYIYSFTEDGYDSEGAGYFNFGFGNFILIREVLYKATGSFIDIFKHSERISLSALYALEFGMTANSYASFGDCPQHTVITPAYAKYIASAFGQPDPTSPGTLMGAGDMMIGVLTAVFGLSAPRVETNLKTNGLHDLRKFYPISGILVARSGRNQSSDLRGTFKLAGNGGHSHDDIGSYTIAVNGVKLSGDPGGPRFYEERTFDYRRYSSVLINSYGHPVPLVSGKMQSQADKLVKSDSWTAQNRILESSFSNNEDRVVYDLKPAYSASVPQLVSLTRTIVYSRLEGSEFIRITDSVKFSSPSMFETAMVGISGWNQTSSSTGSFWSNANVLKSRVTSAYGKPFVMAPEILADYGVNFTRIAIRISDLIMEGSITMEFWAEDPVTTKSMSTSTLKTATTSSVSKTSLVTSSTRSTSVKSSVTTANSLTTSTKSSTSTSASSTMTKGTTMTSSLTKSTSTSTSTASTMTTGTTMTRSLTKSTSTLASITSSLTASITKSTSTLASTASTTKSTSAVASISSSSTVSSSTASTTKSTSTLALTTSSSIASTTKSTSTLALTTSTTKSTSNLASTASTTKFTSNLASTASTTTSTSTSSSTASTASTSTLTKSVTSAVTSIVSTSVTLSHTVSAPSTASESLSSPSSTILTTSTETSSANGAALAAKGPDSIDEESNLLVIILSTIGSVLVVGSAAAFVIIKMRKRRQEFQNSPVSSNDNLTLNFL